MIVSGLLRRSKVAGLATGISTPSRPLVRGGVDLLDLLPGVDLVTDVLEP